MQTGLCNQNATLCSSSLAHCERFLEFSGETGSIIQKTTYLNLTVNVLLLKDVKNDYLQASAKIFLILES